MSILSIRGASARPRGGDGIIAGVWPVGLTGNQTFTPDIPDAVDLIVVLANNSDSSPTTGMTVIHTATRCRILHGPPQPISTNAGLVGRTAVTAIGFTRPITPAVTPGTTAPGLITVTSRPSGGGFDGQPPRGRVGGQRGLGRRDVHADQRPGSRGLPSHVGDPWRGRNCGDRSDNDHLVARSAPRIIGPGALFVVHVRPAPRQYAAPGPRRGPRVSLVTSTRSRIHSRTVARSSSCDLPGRSVSASSPRRSVTVSVGRSSPTSICGASG